MANPAQGSVPQGDAGDAAVAANLSDAASAQGLRPRDVRDGSELTANVSEPGAEHVAEATALGFNTTGWVGIAALVVLVGMLIVKVPAKIGAALDKQIAGVRAQLDEAAKLRAEAEALRSEYEAKAKAAEADAATMRAHAQQEAHQIIAKAKRDAEELMARRTKRAEDKIAAAERSAIAEVRALAAETAAKAAAILVAEHHDAGADRSMIDRAIAGLGRPN
ncbi:F0F1 ATP synthase subunit B family protein [Sphingomonas sp. CLY1604]|uniref:F0F1 ATP synthase subunit B family protein n=1 Tax=Sphingomonas sp. CLY1604 TaxID=3457786 RepID=UPI003FD8472B